MTRTDVPGLDERLRQKVYDHVFANLDHEVGGVLVGNLGNGELPEIADAIAALEAEGRRASVTFTHEAWASIHTTLENDFPGCDIVGWYHSHPGFGIFLSDYDLFIHHNFFSHPRQIAYVVDPQGGTEGVFRWQRGRIEKHFEAKTTRPGSAEQPLGLTDESPRRVPGRPRRSSGSRYVERTGSIQFRLGSRRDSRLRDGRLQAGLLVLLALVAIILVFALSGGSTPGRIKHHVDAPRALRQRSTAPRSARSTSQQSSSSPS
jgi:proteasome lid subunit RPN8/RPN11